MPCMGIESTTFALRDKHQNLRMFLVKCLAYLSLSLKVVGSGLIQSIL